MPVPRLVPGAVVSADRALAAGAAGWTWTTAAVGGVDQAVLATSTTVGTVRITTVLMNSAGSSSPNDPFQNKLHHIFDNPAHHLDPFLNSFGGDKAAAYQAVQQAAQSAAQQQGITGVFNNLIVNVKGFNITVRGNVVGGVVRIGTFFIP